MCTESPAVHAIRIYIGDSYPSGPELLKVHPSYIAYLCPVILTLPNLRFYTISLSFSILSSPRLVRKKSILCVIMGYIFMRMQSNVKTRIPIAGYGHRSKSVYSISGNRRWGKIRLIDVKNFHHVYPQRPSVPIEELP